MAKSMKYWRTKSSGDHPDESVRSKSGKWLDCDYNGDGMLDPVPDKGRGCKSRGNQTQTFSMELIQNPKRAAQQGEL